MKATETRLTFLNLGWPSGLKFVVERGEDRLLFDFGLEYQPGRAPFSVGLQPRPGRELADYMRVGMAPRIDGVYRPEVGAPGKVAGWDGRTHVFISHLHLDHTALVRFLDDRVPLYYPHAMEEVRVAADRSGHVRWRPAPGIAVPDRGTVWVGDIQVEFVAVDHDVPGATGFIITAPDLTIAYTGDCRLHGLRPELTETYAGLARGSDVLIQECVGLGFRQHRETHNDDYATRSPTEQEVIDGFLPLLADRPGLVVVNLYAMNRERLAGLIRACAAAGRTLLMRPADAVMGGWSGIFTGPEQVNQDPSRYVVQLTYDDLPGLLDLELGERPVYIHSGGTPLGPFDPAWQVMRAWPPALGMEFVLHGTSGHSRPEDVERMVRMIAPSVVLPVHSSAPHLLRADGIPVMLPQNQVTYPASRFKRGTLVRAAG